MHARAIETRYKGYRFRSRLEARWAVFFDALGLKWEYESEGFELPSGRYLPDFKVFDIYGNVVWIEIKGVAPSPTEVRRCGELHAATGQWVALAEGLPPAQGRLHRWGPLGYRAQESKDYLGFKPLAQTRAAAEAARGARFEHGESGARR